MSTIRSIALILLFGPAAAMFTEPFFEMVFDIIGWDTENFARPFLNWVYENTNTLYFAMGAGAGVWVHYFAQRILQTTSSEVIDNTPTIEQRGQSPAKLVRGNEWAKGITFMSIRDAACALANVSQSSYLASDRAQAIATELLSLTSRGWIPTPEEYDQCVSSRVVVANLAGVPPFPPKPKPSVDMIVSTITLNHELQGKGYETSWLA